MQDSDFSQLFTIKQECQLLDKINLKIKEAYSFVDDEKFYSKLNHVQYALDDYHNWLKNNPLYDLIVNTINEIFDIYFQKNNQKEIKEKLKFLMNKLEIEVKQILMDINTIDAILNKLLKRQEKIFI